MRVCFHDIHDLSLGLYFDRILEVTNRTLPDNNEFNINDVIEFHNITKYIENDIYHKNWDKEITNNLKSLLGMYKKIIGIFFSKIDNQNIDHFYSTIECNKLSPKCWCKVPTLCFQSNTRFFFLYFTSILTLITI